MQVFYDYSLWNEGQGEPCSRVQNINARFTAGTLERMIPVIYCFEEGIVFDILTVLKAHVMKNYCEKYAEWEDHASELTHAQVIEMTENNPYQNVEIAKVWLNGYLCEEGLTYSSTGYAPGWMGEMENRAALKIKEAYPEYLGSENCFFCQRVQLKTREDWTKEVVSEIRIQTRQLRRTEILDLEAEIQPGEEGRVAFVHPVTGVQHELVIYDTELNEIPGLHSFYAGVAEVLPELSEEERILFDSNLSYEESDPGEGTGDISVIGGAEGPTAVFLAGKSGAEGPSSIFLAGKKNAFEPRYGSVVIPCFSKPALKGDDGGGVFRILGMERVVMAEELIQVYPDTSVLH